MIFSIVTNWLKTSTLWPPSIDVCDELAQRDELAGVLVAELARQAEEARIARRLTQPREAGEDLDLALREALALDLAHDLRAHLLEHGRVERRLLAGELADLVGLDLLGQILRDLCLRAAQDERVDRRAEALRRAFGRRRRSGARSAPRTCRAGRAGPGDTKSKIDQISLRRFSIGVPVSARRRSALQALGRARRRAQRVLDVLRLVEDGVA